MSYILKTTLLLLRIASAIVEGVYSTLQNISDIIESIFATEEFTTSFTQTKGIPYNYQVNQDLSDTNPCILISNLSPNQKIIITDGNIDNSLSIPLSVESKMPSTSNKLERCDVGERSSEEVNPHSDSCVTDVSRNEIEDSRKQTEVVGKSLLLEDIVPNISLDTNDRISFWKKMEEHSSFSSDKNSGTGELRRNLPMANSCNGSDEKVQVLRPKLSPATANNELKRNFNGKYSRELCGRAVGIKRRHLKDKDLDSSTAYPISEAIKTAVPHIPLKKRSSNLEEAVLQESNYSSSRNLEHIASFELNALTKINVPLIDSIEMNFTCVNCLLCSAKVCQDSVCKNEFRMLSSPNTEFENNFTPRRDNHIEINQNSIEYRPIINRQLNGTEEDLARNCNLASMQKDEPSSWGNSLSSQAKDMLQQCRTRAQAAGIREIVDALFLRRFEFEHDNQRTTEGTPVIINESQCKIVGTRSEEQTGKESKVKINEEE